MTLDPKKFVIPKWKETQDGWIVWGLREGKYPVALDMIDVVSKRLRDGLYFPYTAETYTIKKLNKIVVFDLVLIKGIAKALGIEE